MREPRKLKRIVSRAAERPVILVLVEGEKTETQYLTAWQRVARDRILVSIDDKTGLDPKSMVERAVTLRSDAQREERRGRGSAYSEIWCVFDVDEHDRLPDARQQARANGINLAVSNPCVELWLLLHFQEQHAHLERGQAHSVARGHLSCGKNLTPSALKLLLENYMTARDRAIALDAEHVRNGKQSGANPGSDIWRLVDRIVGG